ncbi:hypothetical protein DESC_720237 [Desulfosarcina cetonica]|nr:hypothetical protein DESC_720237 [Desulfosarcina cetonica]
MPRQRFSRRDPVHKGLTRKSGCAKSGERQPFEAKETVFLENDRVREDELSPI